MNNTEYRRKTHPEMYRRSWSFTLITTLLATFVAIGMFASWRYLGHDAYIIGSVLVPAGIVFLMLVIVAFNGRKRIIKEAYFDLLEFIFWWRP